MAGDIFPGADPGRMPRLRAGLGSRLLAAAGAGALAGAGGAVVVAWALPGAAPAAVAAAAVAAATLLVTLPLLFLALAPLRRTLAGLADGLAALGDHDTSLRLRVPAEGALEALVGAYNRAADALRDERVSSREKEVLLETVLQAAPMALLLTDERERIVFANRGARDTFALPRGAEGRSFGELVAGGPPALAEALAAGRDALFTVEQDGEREAYHLARRGFELNGRRHALTMVRRLTPELRRQEVAMWKRAIRTMSHEINNSLAPIASLARSSRRLADEPAQRERLLTALAVIAERAAHLESFLAGYARFARLPQPVLAEVAWRPFLDDLAALSAFRLNGEPPARPVRLDAGQMQQVLLNLLTNAREAGSPAEDVVVTVAAVPEGGVLLRVADRGRGMDEEEMRSALLPFFSTKRSGAGLGLALCREIVEAHGGRLRLEQRPGGGTAVVCWLPG